MWHFRSNEKIFDCNTKFRPKSTFNPKNKDVIIETYLSSLEVKLLDIDIPKDKFNNLSKEERDALYSLKNDNTIVIKRAEKGSAVVYLNETHKQLSDEDVYEDVTNDPSTLDSSVNFLDVKVIMKDGKIITNLYVKPTGNHHATHIIAKKLSLTAKLCV